MNKKLLTIPTLMLIAAIGFSSKVSAESVTSQLGITATGGSASANTSVNSNVQVNHDMNDTHAMRDNHETRTGMTGAYGVVTAVNDNTITITTLAHGEDAAPQTFTINASGAVVDKNKVVSTLSGVAVGDMIFAEGSANGSVFTATKIHDGVMLKGNKNKNHNNDNNGDKGDKTDASANAIAMLEGNGQPIVGGTVSAINGNTVTITNKSNASYTVDISNAKISKNGTTTTASNVAIGDTLLAQGTINGTSVTAVNIVDSANASANVHTGFFGSIGGFFARLFGFRK
jgi:hypothetical protein